MSEALRLAELIERDYHDETLAPRMAAAELRRLHQSEREGWRWADELEQERKRLHALNAELVEALREMLENGGDFTAKRDKARAALAKAKEASK